MLYGRQIRRVAKAVVAEFPGLLMGPYSYWRKDDSSWSYDEDEPHSTRIISFGSVVAGDFYAVPMEDEYRGESWEVRNVETERELANFIRQVVMEEAKWLGISVEQKVDPAPSLRPNPLEPAAAQQGLKYGLIAVPSIRR